MLYDDVRNTEKKIAVLCKWYARHRAISWRSACSMIHSDAPKYTKYGYNEALD